MQRMCLGWQTPRLAVGSCDAMRAETFKLWLQEIAARAKHQINTTSPSTTISLPHDYCLAQESSSRDFPLHQKAPDFPFAAEFTLHQLCLARRILQYTDRLNSSFGNNSSTLQIDSHYLTRTPPQSWLTSPHQRHPSRTPQRLLT